MFTVYVKLPRIIVDIVRIILQNTLITRCRYHSTNKARHLSHLLFIIYCFVSGELSVRLFPAFSVGAEWLQLLGTYQSSAGLFTRVQTIIDASSILLASSLAACWRIAVLFDLYSKSPDRLIYLDTQCIVGASLQLFVGCLLNNSCHSHQFNVH